MRFRSQSTCRRRQDAALWAMEAMECADPFVRRDAAEALAEIGPPAATRDVLWALVKALKDYDGQVRLAAVKSLANLGKASAREEFVLNALARQPSRGFDPRGPCPGTGKTWAVFQGAHELARKEARDALRLLQSLVEESRP